MSTKKSITDEIINELLGQQSRPKVNKKKKLEDKIKKDTQYKHKVNSPSVPNEVDKFIEERMNNRRWGKTMGGGDTSDYFIDGSHTKKISSNRKQMEKEYNDAFN
jgi:hypothetical protein